MIVRKTLSEQVYEELKKEILNKQIAFGQKLINKNLQERFGVSSTPIRDAINKLYINGLIQSKTNTGATVIEPDWSYFCEINEILQYIQLTALELAYKKNDHFLVADEAEKFIHLQEGFLETDLYYDYDYEFHKVFCDYSKNNILKDLFKNYNILHEILVREYNKTYIREKRRVSINYHKRIVRSFKDGDIKKSSDLMLEHYEKAQIYFKSN